MRLGGAFALLLILAGPAVAAPADGLRLTGRAEQGGLLFGTLPAGATGLMLDGIPVPLTPDGRFLIGFSRDAGPAELAWRAASGVPEHRTIAVAPRHWDVQSLPTLPSHPVSDAEFEARRPGELARIAAARAPASTLLGWTQSFIRPAAGPVTGVYGSQRILSGTPQAPHAGLDIGAPAGSPVVAPASGIVRLAEGPFTLEGNLVLLDHGAGLVSAFLHLSAITVHAGQAVTKGELIGRVGGTGRATGPHLHWGLTWTHGGETVRVDPAQLVLAT